MGKTQVKETMMNKKTIRCALCAAGLAAAAAAWGTATDDSYQAVVADWYDGGYSNVLELADARLAANSNDLVGVCIKAEYAICFQGIAEISNSVARMVEVCGSPSAGAFTNEFQYTSGAWRYFLEELVPSWTESDVALQHQKSALPHRKMCLERSLRIISEMGLWETGNGNN